MKVKEARGVTDWFLRRISRWAICLPPFGVYVLPERLTDVFLLAHERIHWEQAQKLGAVRFYVKYLWLLIRYGYHKHPMEIKL